MGIAARNGRIIASDFSGTYFFTGSKCGICVPSGIVDTSKALEVEGKRRRMYYSGGVKLLYKKSFPSIEFVFSFRNYFRCRSSYSIKNFRRVIVGATSP